MKEWNVTKMTPSEVIETIESHEGPVRMPTEKEIQRYESHVKNYPGEEICYGCSYPGMNIYSHTREFIRVNRHGDFIIKCSKCNDWEAARIGWE
ncbi:MAG: hypothetical protein QXP07_00125 [Candidatus Parvarchaeum sp.]|jgi:hypothetical protein|nr:hypothetical protein [Candidatus Parvarchaeum tengchongense]